MPGTLQTFSNPGGTPMATSADEFYQRQRLANQQQANNAAELQAHLQDSAANRALQLQTMGSYADRANQDTSMETMRAANAMGLGRLQNEGSLATARAGNEPQMGRIAMEQTNANRVWDAGKSDREFNSIIGEATNNALRMRMGGGQSPQPSAIGSVFQDQGRAIAGPPTASGQLPAGPARPAWITSMVQPGGGGSVASGGSTLSMDDIIRAKMGIPSDRPSEATVYDRGQVRLSRRTAPLEHARDSAFQSGKTTEAIALQKQIDSINGDAPSDYSNLATVYKPTGAAANAKQTAISDSAQTDFKLNQGLLDINEMIKDVKDHKTDIKSVVSKAQEIRDGLVNDYQMDPQRANALLADHLDKSLPGVGSEIMSAMQDVASAIYTPGVRTVQGKPFRFGVATDTREALKQKGLLR